MSETLTRPSSSAPDVGRLLVVADRGSAAELSEHRLRWGDLPVLSGEALIDLADDSGLLGRGGAGFPLGRKLRSVASRGRGAVVVANGAESEPASAKDKVLMSAAPHLVLDGIQLAARAVGADRAYLVVHNGAAAVSVGAALRQRTDAVPVAVAGLPDVLRRYVSSEETSIVRWLNGGAAIPTFTPPRPFEAGVGRRPTLVSNVETLAHLATIARRGADWFRSVGDANEPGTILVTVSAPGIDRRVLEAPTGVELGDLLTAAGTSAGAAKAVLVGGFFGTWFATDQVVNLKLSQHHLRAAGGSLGAGVVAALPADRCGLAESARVAGYLASQGAGQCGPCLNGLPAIAGALAELAAGRWDDGRSAALDRWLRVVPGRGACRHPDGAVRFVESALRVFADDVAAHRAGRPCQHAWRPGWFPLPAPSARALERV